MATTYRETTGGNTAVTALVLMIVALLAVAIVWLMQDHRSGGERLGDAVEAVPQGLDKAVNKLGDQPPGKNVERNLGDATKQIQ